MGRIRPHHAVSPHLALGNQCRFGESLNLSMDRGERSVDPAREVSEAELLIRMEQQQRQDLALHLAPKNRK